MKGNLTKRIFAMMLAGIMTAGCLGGCGQSNEGSSAENTAAEDKAQAENTSKAENTQGSTSGEKKPDITEPVTIEVYSIRQDGDTNDANGLYIFKHLEAWLAEQGYDVTFAVTAPPTSDEAAQQISVMLGTGNLPDMIWYSISTANVVTYGMEEGLLLDWAPYLNEETMPNLTALFEETPAALVGSTTPDGGVYSLPVFLPENFDTSNGNYPEGIQAWINTAWLEEAGLEMPTTVDEFIDMLRAFKNHKHAEGLEVWSVTDYGSFLPNCLVWSPAGYYGKGSGTRYGTDFMIKDEEVWLPAYTEDYRTLVTLYNTMYEEGLLHPDFLTMDTATRRALVENDRFGVFHEYNPADQLGMDAESSVYENWAYCSPLVKSEGDLATWSTVAPYSANVLWASADTKYPELLAMIVDYLYSVEGSTMYQYGPMAGKDPLNLVEGWTMDETGTISAAGNYESMWKYRTLMLFPNYGEFNRRNLEAYTMELAGVELEIEYKECTDPVTGKTRSLPDYNLSEGIIGYRNEERTKWKDSMTTISLPKVYLSSEDALRVSELQTVINEYINAETAKFIVGERPLEEVDNFWKELETMGVEEYIEIYREAYAPYLESVFGN